MKVKVIKEFIDRENDMTHRKIGETFEVWSRHAVSLRLKTNVSSIAVGDGFPDVPKRNLYINLKFGQPFFQNNPNFPLDLPTEALG